MKHLAGLFALVLAACGSLNDSPALRPGQPAPAAATQFVIAYVIPSTGRQDGTVSVRFTDSSGKTTRADVGAGAFTRVQQLPTNSTGKPTRPVILLQKIDGTTTTLDLDRSVSTASSMQTTLPSGAILGNGDLLLARAGGIARFDSSAAQVQTYQLQRPQFGARTVDGTPTKAAVDPNAARVAFIGAGPDGHLYATVDNSVNAAVLDLSAGRRLDLAGTGYVEGGVATASGLFLVLWDPSKTGTHFSIARIELAGFTIAKTADLSANPWTGIVDGVEVAAISDSSLVVYLSQAGSTGAGHRSTVTQIDAATLAATDRPLPDDSGLHMAIGVDNNIYVFGGVAKGRITRVDPSTWSASTVTLADGLPSEAFVVALFVR